MTNKKPRLHTLRVPSMIREPEPANLSEKFKILRSEYFEEFGIDGATDFDFVQRNGDKRNTYYFSRAFSYRY